MWIKEHITGACTGRLQNASRIASPPSCWLVKAVRSLLTEFCLRAFQKS